MWQSYCRIWQSYFDELTLKITLALCTGKHWCEKDSDDVPLETCVFIVEGSWECVMWTGFTAVVESAWAVKMNVSSDH